MPLVDVNSESELRKFIESERKLVVSFSSSNVPQCDHVYSVLKILSEDSADPEIAFVNVDAVAVSEVAKQLKVDSVPTVLFFLSGKEINRVSGVDIPDITKAVMNLQSMSNGSSNDLASRLHSLVNMAPIMLFMKGSPEEPRCGFSRQIISILRSNNAKFGTFDILQDEEVRQGLKSYSNWPTYPQLYIKGELVGGVDIVRELAESGELAQMLTIS
uniref:Thioredoxin-like 2 n=1 Tax=Schistosoma japonicum TaxID=6182 RepID=C1LIE3_SCHJA|nr:thioredoxin-like 2 [Schistosoma japonicum]